MKSYCMVIWGLTFTFEALAQGQIWVSNYAPVAGLDAPIFDADCVTRLEGEAYSVQAYIGFGLDSLRPLGAVRPFRTGKAAGYFEAIALTIPGTGQHDKIYFQLRAWESKAGSSYDAAVAAGAKYGFSNIIPMTTVLPPGTPHVPVGLQSFCLVPEPGPGVLLALGGGLWLWAARRRGPGQCGV